MSVAPFYLIGGIHPPECKAQSNQTPIATMPIAPRLHIALQQSRGAASIACVQIGEQVLANQLLATSAGAMSVALHAPAAGLVESMSQFPALHPSKLPETVLVLKTDTVQNAVAATPLAHWHSLPKDEVLAFLQNMGIVGLGGAMFPSHIKAKAATVNCLILNGAECEPFVTCDDRLMREAAGKILAGAKILAHLLAVDKVLIGIEENKPEAIEKLTEEAAKEHQIPIHVLRVPTKYPSGSLKQLIYLLTGKILPSGALPSSIGVQVFNVGTAFAVFEAVAKGLPLTRRVVTLTGDVAQPKNVWALIGTPIAFLMQNAHISRQAKSVIVGGSMMGEEVHNFSIGINKGSNALIAKSPAVFRQPQVSSPCIRCGACSLACPQQLQPLEFVWLSKSGAFQKTKNYAIFDCIECAACDFVCPSQIKLVDYIKHAKSQLQRLAQEKRAADQAQMRHEFRLFRLQREQQEKTERLARIHAQAKENLAVKTSQIATAKNTLLPQDLQAAVTVPTATAITSIPLTQAMEQALTNSAAPNTQNHSNTHLTTAGLTATSKDQDDYVAP